MRRSGRRPGSAGSQTASRPDHIAWGGRNVLNYLAAEPARIVAIHPNPNHIAVMRLKLAALRTHPSHEGFFRFLGEADDERIARFSTMC